MKKDKHHLVPKHRGGTDADGLVEVTKKQHAMFHFCEWKLHGHKEDYIAWKALAGLIGKEEAYELARDNAKVGWRWEEHPDSYAKLKATMATQETRERQREGARRRMKPVLCLETGVRYESTAEASRALSLRREHIIRYLRNGKYAVKGYTFAYCD